jgi:hypothetical protein
MEQISSTRLRIWVPFCLEVNADGVGEFCRGICGFPSVRTVEGLGTQHEQKIGTQPGSRGGQSRSVDGRYRGVRTIVDMVYRASSSDIHKLLEVVGQLPASCKLGGRIVRSREGEEGERGVA